MRSDSSGKVSPCTPVRPGHSSSSPEPARCCSSVESSFFLVGMVWAGSRGALAALGAGTIVWLLLSGVRPRRPRALLAGCIALMALLVMAVAAAAPDQLL